MTNEVKNVPELRFPEFSEEWEEKILDEVSTFSKGKGISKNDLSKDGTPCILYGELYTTYDFIINKIKSKTLLDTKNLVKGKKNQVLIPSSGETPLDIATAAVINTTEDILLGGDINVLTPVQKYDGNFISLSINGKNKSNLSKYAQGKSVVHLYNNDIKKLKIKFPVKKSEQRKIGNFFSKLDRQIELEEQKLKKLEEQKKGYMQKIFSQELRFKDEKGNYYPEWESRYLNELCLINPKVDQVPNSFLYIDLESVNNGKIEKIKEVNKINAPSRAQRLAKKYDVFYQTVRPYQKNNFINLSNRNDIVVSTGYAQLRPSVQFYYLYSLLLTNSFMNKVLVKCTGTNYPAINSTDLSLIQILSSSVFEEQEKIGNFFSKLDELINKQNQKIDGLKKRKRGFLQKMFV